MTKPNVILLFQAIDTHTDVSFDYPLEQKLRDTGPETFLTCDSLSDQVTVHYLKSMLENERAVTLVFDCRTSSKLGAGRTLLNACIRKQGIQLVVIGDSAPLQPFLQLMRGKVVDSEEQLVAYLNSK